MPLDVSRLSVLESRLASWLPDGVAVSCCDPEAGATEEDVFAVEASAVARAVPKRRAEFFAGRAAAHRAMAALGHLPEPVPMRADRAPAWPHGLVGTISHCIGACAAVVAKSEKLRSVAVDLEPDASLPDEVIPSVCLPTERRWLAGLDEARRGRVARLIFSAKECGFKLLYPLSGQTIDFDQAEVTLQLDDGRFQLRFERGVKRPGVPAVLEGRFGLENGLIFCLMFLLQTTERKSEYSSLSSPGTLPGRKH